MAVESEKSGLGRIPPSPDLSLDSLPHYALSAGLAAMLWVKPLRGMVADSKERRRGTARVCLLCDPRPEALASCLSRCWEEWTPHYLADPFPSALKVVLRLSASFCHISWRQIDGGNMRAKGVKKDTPYYVAAPFAPLCCVYRHFGEIGAKLPGRNPPLIWFLPHFGDMPPWNI
jgi:hypothetical protein